MSATNRGAERVADDFYETPPWVTRLILEVAAPPPLLGPISILEPAAGTGAIIDELIAYGYPSENIVGVEIDPSRADAAGAMCANFLELEPNPVYELVITNPPYSLALDFAKHAIEFVRPGGLLVLLMRLNWLASIKRAAWLRENTPDVWVIPKRPSFTGKGTDATDYAWFTWAPGVYSATVEILPVPSPEEIERKRIRPVRTPTTIPAPAIEVAS